MGKANEVKETAQQRAMAQVARQVMSDFQRRWAPLISRNAKQIVAAGLPDSVERRRADTMATLDTNVAFTGAAQKLDATAAAAGDFGSSRHKLGLTGLSNDQATSTGLATVAADQAGDDALVTGLSAVGAQGRGQQTTAINGMSTAADLSGRRAQADANAALENRMGNAQLAGQLVGLGSAAYLSRTPAEPTLFSDKATSLPDQLPNEARRLGLSYPG